MILLINICKEKLHYFEFVKPIEDILVRNKKKRFIKHYTCLKKEDLEKASKIIICGTSLKDDGFIKNFHKFDWLYDTDKPVLGICGGMQIIGLVFGGILKGSCEIGFYKERFKKDFLGLKDEQEVYHLHNNYICFDSLKEFEVFSKKISHPPIQKNVSQAVKHKKKEIYGVLFHPEVRNKKMIKKFCEL